MADLFKEIIPSMTTTKQYLDDIDGYNTYVVNMALANHVDCILYASEMNGNSHLTSRMQYDYYFHSIRKGKRPFAFEKKSKNNDIDVIKEWFDCSTNKAKEYAKILTQEQINTLKKRIDKGGK